MGEKGHLFIAVGSANLYNHLWKSVWFPWVAGSRFTSRSSYTTLGHISKGCYILLLRHLLIRVHCCPIHNGPKLETMCSVEAKVVDISIVSGASTDHGHTLHGQPLLQTSTWVVGQTGPMETPQTTQAVTKALDWFFFSNQWQGPIAENKTYIFH